MAAEEAAISEKVQNYLDKHKIISLFEDLKSKIIKDLPSDPYEFLVSKLQALYKQKKKVTTTRPATSSGVPSSRTRIQVTGTSVASASKLKSPSTAKSKAGVSSTSSPSLTKTPTRPSSGAKSDSSKSTHGSKLKPTASTSTTPKRPTTAPAAGKSSLPSPSKSTGLRSPSKLSTSSTSSASKPSPAKTRSGLKPPATGASRAGVGAVKKTTTTQATKDKSKLPPKKTQAVKKVPAQEQPTPSKAEASAEEVADFFGEPKRPNVDLTVRHLDTDELSVPSVGSVESDSEAGERGEDGEACDCKGLSLDSLLQLKMSKKQEKKNKHSSKKTKSHLHVEDDLSTTPPSLGYHSGSGDGCGESEEDDCVEAVEDLAVLEDEGVTGLAGKQSSTLPKDKVDFVVLLCARCAKMLTGDEPIAEMSAIVVTKGAASDFESASQVGSHASFPQWEVGTEADSEASSANCPTSSCSDTSTNITLVSRDTWGGLAPKSRPVVPGTSDEESEVQLPPPPPLEGRPWKEESPHPHDPHGWAT